MSNKKQSTELEMTPIVNIFDEANLIEELINDRFTHQLKNGDISLYIVSLYSMLDREFSKTLISSNKGHFIHFVLDDLRENIKLEKLFEDEEYLIFRNFFTVLREIETHSDFRMIESKVITELVNERMIFSNANFKLKDVQPNDYKGFDSSSATHPSIDVFFENEYATYSIENHSYKINNYIEQNLLIHLLELLSFNNGAKIQNELRDYHNKTKANRNELGEITVSYKEDLNHPFLKILVQIPSPFKKAEKETNILIEEYFANDVNEVQQKSKKFNM